MNFVVASSRGVGLREYLPNRTHVTTTPGGRLITLMHEAKNALPPPHGLTRRYHVYFVSGIPDITHLVKNNSQRHRECTYEDEPQATADRYNAELDDCQRTILNCGALPIFATRIQPC